MNQYHDWSDEQVAAEIAEYLAVKKKLGLGKIAVIAGENRRIEYFPSDMSIVNAELRELAAEARSRNMPIGGEAGGAIPVEFG